MYMMYKHLHITLALLTFLLFFVRGIWLIKGSPKLSMCWTKIVPHILATLLIISGIMLALTLGFKPSAHPWIIAKIAGLIFFILLSVFAFKAKSQTRKALLFSEACVVYFYIVGVALTKNPLIFF